MESDCLTKALQGKTFHAHRKTLMGLEHIFYEKYKINGDENVSASPPTNNK